MQITRQSNPKADICSKCIGFCCFRFYINMPVMEGAVDWDKAESGFAGDLEDFAFARKHFKLVRVVSDTRYSNRAQCEMTCAQYDTAKHICTCYKDRPLTCRSYVCDTAYFMHRVPDRRSYPPTTKAMKSAGIDMSCVPDGRRTPKQVPWQECDVHRKLSATTMRYPGDFDYGLLKEVNHEETAEIADI